MKRTASLSIVVVIVTFASLAAFAQSFTAGAVAGEPAAGPQAQQGEFRWSEPLAAGRVIEIKGVNGKIGRAHV